MKLKVKFSEIILRLIIYLAAILTCFSLIAIVFYIIGNGIGRINFKFLISSYSESPGGEKGILPMIINTFYVLVITMLISFPIGLGSAIYTTQYSKSKMLRKIASFSSDILSGIPSIIFGLFGYSIFCSKFRLGTSIISGCLTMAICVLPTIIRGCEEALEKVPEDYKEAAISLGANKLQVTFDIILPSAMRDITNTISLCMGKILGESAILLYTVGMSYFMPKGIFSHVLESGRTLTLHLYQIAKQSNDEDSLSITFATATILLILIFVFNTITDLITKLFYAKYDN